MDDKSFWSRDQARAAGRRPRAVRVDARLTLGAIIPSHSAGTVSLESAALWVMIRY